jgi:phosphoserine phosphatase RsbU/P
LFAFTLGDVSGKGISAAVMMASIQSLLRGQLLRGPLPLASLMNEMNLAVYRSSPPERYSTLFCGVLNAERSRLTFANAGHMPPLLIRAHPDGQPPRVHGLAESGLPIGLFEFAQYEQFSIEIAPRDLVVCFSDGISDATNPRHEVWEDAGIESVLWQCRDAPVQEIVERIIKAADDFTAGAEQSDDMTLTAVRIT